MNHRGLVCLQMTKTKINNCINYLFYKPVNGALNALVVVRTQARNAQCTSRMEPVWRVMISETDGYFVHLQVNS